MIDDEFVLLVQTLNRWVHRHVRLKHPAGFDVTIHALTDEDEDAFRIAFTAALARYGWRSQHCDFKLFRLMGITFKVVGPLKDKTVIEITPAEAGVFAR